MPLLVPHGVVKTRRGLGFCGVVLFGLQILCFCFLYVATVFLHHKFVRHKRGFSIYLSVLFVKKVSSNCSEYANKTVSFQSRKMLNGGEMLTFKWSQACSLLIVRFSKKLILRFLACGIVTLIFTVEEVIILQQTFIEEMEILQPFILFQPFILTSEALLRQQHIFVIELTVYIMLLQ